MFIAPLVLQSNCFLALSLPWALHKGVPMTGQLCRPVKGKSRYRYFLKSIGSVLFTFFSGLLSRLQISAPTIRTLSSSKPFSQNVPSHLWKLGRLNHVAIAVPDLEKAQSLYKDVLGAQVSETVALPEHGVYTVFVELGNTKLELLHPLGEKSPIASFLQKNKTGGMHHICIEVF